MGLASAVWGGFFAALLGGSQYNIAGPTASGAGILAVYSLRYGYQILPFIAIISGILMLAALALRLDKYVLLLPGGVMHGWTIGVAFTIACNQLAFAFGINNLTKHEQFYMNVFEVISHLGQTQVGPFFVFLIAVIFIVTLGFMRPKIPWTIIVALVGILLGVLSANNAWLFHMDILKERYTNLHFSLFQTPTFKSSFFTGEILTASFSIAFISILESLLSAKVADRLTGTRFAQPLEVFGIAFANIIAGTFNGIPVTAALARTALNINSGATNRMAAILNGISCGLIALLLIKVLGYMPLAIIAALLVNVAIRMVNLANMTHLWLYDSTQFRIAVFTGLVTVFMDPATGIIYGAVLSIFLHGLHAAEAWSEITAGNDASQVVTHSSMELDRQALHDTFERQFPPTLKPGDSVEMVVLPPIENTRAARRRARRRRLSMEDGGNTSGEEHRFSIGSAGELEGTMDDDLEAAIPLDQHGIEDEDFVGLDEDYESDDEDAEHIANRVFITAPKYKADHLIVRFPGEISYLNAEQHADRLAPLLNTGRFVILHLKRTYYVDLDGMDMLTALVNKVEKHGHTILLSGLTPQILPNMEIFDWFVRAREENRIVPDYKNAVARIRELDVENRRRLDEANYHDITAYELEESRRHEQYLANVEAARVAREERAVKEVEEARVAAENNARLDAEAERKAVEEAERRQVALAAKRRADAEEFQRRLEEYDRTKQEREVQRAAYLAAAAESSAARDGPSITVPHHHDHRQPPRRSSSSLKLADTPIYDESNIASSSEAYAPVPTTAPEHMPAPEDVQQREEVAAVTPASSVHIESPAPTPAQEDAPAYEVVGEPEPEPVVESKPEPEVASAPVEEQIVEEPVASPVASPVVPSVFTETPEGLTIVPAPAVVEEPTVVEEPSPVQDAVVEEPQSIVEEPSTIEPVESAPVAAEEASQAPASEPIVEEKPVEVVEEEPVAVEEPIASEPSVVEEEPIVEPASEPIVEEPATPAVTQEEVVAEAPIIEEPIVSEPAAVEEPIASEPAAVEEPIASEPTVEEPATPAAAPVAEEVEPENPPIVDEAVTDYGHVDIPDDSIPAEEPVTFTEEKPSEEEKPEAPAVTDSYEDPFAIVDPPHQQQELLPEDDIALIPDDSPSPHQDETSTPPPESETSSVASEPHAAQSSPRFDHPEPVAPLDEEDPFASEPIIPKGDSMPSFALPFSASQSQPTQEEEHQTEQSAPTDATIEFLDPFADFSDAGSISATPQSSVPSTPVKPATQSVPSTPVAPIAYDDPFGQFEGFSESTPVATPSATPQKAPAPATPSATDVDFDPFAELLSPSSASNIPPPRDDDEDDDDLL